MGVALFKRKKQDEKEGRKTEKQPDETVGVGEVAVALPKGSPAQVFGEPKILAGRDADAYRIILRPHITEKGSAMGAENKYVFRVSGNANKTEIKKAIARLYKVGVAKVRVLQAPPKYRRVGRYEGQKPGFKKAIVTLKEGSKIDLAS